ncbi:MAG TPA: CCA tRNA nucleotidyltransferase [Desulfotomaculum sp.]|nr:MAG: hypothetical protein JL56_16155 [Desulfotomaculum sp. BICA1-6]HBX22210.1 CCA tRNA nucleotidyltransferase [Desulfotomaculum sp.]
MQINTVLKAINHITSGNAYLVGGSVRDLLLGYEPRDIDLVVSGSAQSMIYDLAKLTTIRPVILHKEHDIARAVLPGFHVDITGLGNDALLKDLKRRDFTINAMALPVKGYLQGDWSGHIIDPLGGLTDLRRGIIKVCSPGSLNEDPVRVLRAARLQARLGFGIDPDTLKLMQNVKKPLAAVPGERVWEELRHILGLPDAAVIIYFLTHQTKVLEQVFPEIAPMQQMEQNFYHADNVWVHSFKTLIEFERVLKGELLPGVAKESITKYLENLLSNEEKRLPVIKLACLFHDVGKLATRGERDDGRITFYGHHQVGGPMVELIGRRLKFSKRELKLFRLLVEWHMQPLFLYKNNPPSTKAVFRFFGTLGEAAPVCLLLSLADVTSSRRATGKLELAKDYADYIGRMLERFVSEKDLFLNTTPLLSGEDICNELNLAPSPLIGKLKDVLWEAQLEGKVTTRRDAVELLKMRQIERIFER